MNARQFLLNLVIVVVLLAIGGGIAYESYESNNYVATDNAQVQVPMVDVASLSAGALQSLSVSVGDSVHAGETLAVVATPAASSGAASAPTTAPTTSRTAKGAKGAKTVTTVVPTTQAAPGLVSITAPVSGVVSEIGASAGQTVLPGETLVEIAEPKDAVVVANIPETSIRNVVDGQSVNVTLDAYPGTTFKGHVEAVQPATQASLSLFPASALSGSFTKVTQLVPVWVTFNSQGDTVYNGLSAEVSIQIGNGSL